jgi:uncharacterized protein YbjT (DUF2867 family)
LRHLVEQGWKVRALTRNPQSGRAQALQNQGVEVASGDYDDSRSLEQALEGVHGVFLPSFQVNLRVSPAREARYGTALVGAAKQAGISHLVYSSETGAAKEAGLGHLESKWQIENRIRELGLPATILRHALFLDWLAGPMGPVFWRALARAPERGRIIQVIALDDVGAFAARAFGEPELYIGKELEIAGDGVSLDRLLEAYRKVQGKAPGRSLMPSWLVNRMGDFGKALQRISNQEGHADIAALRLVLPNLKNAEEGLRAAGPMHAPSGKKMRRKS